ncbi:hypothetical protein GCM10027275_46240 [Rhabdobacter roseus]|uniref:Uncharacterized protein n=1 Tax=Rhabdobacter roseus TaxID=1655419 RepID=A0A840TQU6_9BACT|nr:hypothetical protein [Rhabdobacter roseus]MBB5286706.1 hypothetical protein [Rhabdobacter roseus]
MIKVFMALSCFKVWLLDAFGIEGRKGRAVGASAGRYLLRSKAIALAIWQIKVFQEKISRQVPKRGLFVSGRSCAEMNE